MSDNERKLNLEAKRKLNDPKNRKALTLLEKAYELAPELSRNIGPVVAQVKLKFAEEDRQRRAADKHVFRIASKKGAPVTSVGRQREFVIESMWGHWLASHGAPPSVYKSARTEVHPKRSARTTICFAAH